MRIQQGQQTGTTIRMAGLIVMLALLHSGESTAKPGTDLSTPRAVLVAHWSNRDAYAKLLPHLANELRVAERRATAETGVKTLLTGEAFKAQEDLENSNPDPVVVYDRKILEEKKMSDTMVMITVKVTNISPLPTGVSLSADEAKTRAEGVRLRYQIALTPAGWRISQVYEYQDWRSENDENLRWSPLYSNNGAVKLYEHLSVNAFSN